MIAALIVSAALAAQGADPYSALADQAAQPCREGEAAFQAGRAQAAAERFQLCELVIFGYRGLQPSQRFTLLARVSDLRMQAFSATGDEAGARQAQRNADRYSRLAAQGRDLDRIAEAEAAFEAGDYRAAEQIWLVLLVEAEAGENLTGSVHQRQFRLARTLLPQGRAEEAVPLLEQALPAAQAAGDDATLISILNQLAEAYFDLGRYEDSAAILRPLYKNAEGEARMSYANNLARALDGAGRHREAETLLREVAAHARAEDGGPFVWPHALARNLFNLARNLAAQGEHAEAGALFEESAALTVERRPPGHTDIIAAHAFLARHRLLAEDDPQAGLAAARTLSANLDAYLTESSGEVDRNRAIQNAAAPAALFTLHVEAAWRAAREA